MTKTREQMISHLTDAIVSGSLRDRRVCLAYVLDQSPDILLDNDGIASLLTGDATVRHEILWRAEKDAARIVRHWLTDTPGGKRFVDSQIEREAEETEE